MFFFLSIIAKKRVLEGSALKVFVIIGAFDLVGCHSSFSIKFCYGDGFAVTMPMSI